MEPTEYFRIIRRRWPLVVAFVLIGMAVGYLTAKSSPAGRVSAGPAASTYQATSILATASSTASDPSGLSLDAMAFLAQTGPVPAMASKALGDNSGGSDIASHVQVSAKDPLNLLQVTASEPSRSQAVQVANGFADQIVAYINDQLQVTYQANLSTDNAQLNSLSSVMSKLQAQQPSPLVQSELGVAQGQYSQLYVSYQQLLLAGPQHTGLHVINPATASTTPQVANGGITHVIASTSKTTRLALGGLAGLILGLGLALIWDRIDTRIQTREQAEKIFGMAVLGEIPKMPRGRHTTGLVVVEAPSSRAAEAFRMLQTGLALSRPAGTGKRPQAILISSSSRMEGKAAVVANLAASFSEAGSSVALVAVDPSDLELPKLLGASASPGQLIGEPNAPPMPAERSYRPMDSAAVIERVSVLMNGTRPSSGKDHADLVATGRRLADVVLVDTPPALATHEAGRLSAVVDSVVLLCELGRVTTREATLTVDGLRRVGAPLHGLVLVANSGLKTRLLRPSQLVRRGHRPQHISQPLPSHETRNSEISSVGPENGANRPGP